MVLVPLLRVVTFLLGIVQLLWIGRYVYQDFGGLLGVVVAWFAFPLTLMISPIYGVLAHGDWAGVLLFALGPVTYIALGRLGATRVGGPAPAAQRDPSPAARPEPAPATPPSPAPMTARESSPDPIELQLEALAVTQAQAAEGLRRIQEQGLSSSSLTRRFGSPPMRSGRSCRRRGPTTRPMRSSPRAMTQSSG